MKKQRPSTTTDLAHAYSGRARKRFHKEHGCNDDHCGFCAGWTWGAVDGYKAARRRMSLKEYTACYWCRAPFADDHILALAQPEKGRNRLLCQDCAKLLQSSSQGERDVP